MATQLFFRDPALALSDYSTGNNDAKLDGVASGWKRGVLSTVRGAGVTGLATNTVTGPTSGVEFTNGGGDPPVCFYSAPLDADVTISGSITWNLWAAENNMGANVAINGRLEVIDGATGAITLIDQTVRVTEVAVTTATVNNFAETPAAGVACKRGDRLRVRVFADDAGTMASGFTFTFTLAAASAGANGDSYLTLTENLTFVAEPAGSQVFLTDTASVVATASVDREAWTTRGAGVMNDVTNTVAGWTAPIHVTDVAAGTVVDWFTKPLTAFTLGGAVRCNIRAVLSVSAAALRVEIAVVNGDGTAPTVWAVSSTEALETVETVTSLLVSGDDLSVVAGKRLRIRVYIDDSPRLAMTTGETVTLYYAGASGATGDTFFKFTQTLVESSTGTTFTQAVAGGLTFSGTFVKRPGKSVVGGLTFAGAFNKFTSRTLPAGLTFVGVIAKRTARGVTGGLTFSGALAVSRLFSKALTGGLSFVGALTVSRLFFRTFVGGLSFVGGFIKRPGKFFAAGLTFSGALSKSTARALIGGLTFSGALAVSRLFSKALVGGLSFVGGFAKQTRKVLPAGLTFVGAIGKMIPKVFAGGLSFSGSVVKQTSKALAGGLSFSGSFSKLVSKSFAGALSFIGNLTTNLIPGGVLYFKSLVGGLSFSGGLTRMTGKALAGVVSSTGSLVKRTARSLSGGLTFSGVLTRGWVYFKSLTGGLSFSGSLGSVKAGMSRAMQIMLNSIFGKPTGTSGPSKPL